MIPWIARTQLPGSSFGSLGLTVWFRPDAPSLIGGFHTLTPPPGVVPIDTPVSWANYRGESLLETGGSSENMVVTGDFGYWKQGIRPPVNPPTGTLGGAGWTASLIAAFTWYDEKTAEHSALSESSVIFAAANQALTITNANIVPTNPRVTHIGIWLSVDGNLFRLAALRQIGVAGSITLPSTIGELGEAFVEDFDVFPRCKFNVIWHDRQVMAGDDQNPNIIYFSLIGLPERRALFSIPTKSGQPVTGLFVVNDQLIVGCPFASERVSGYTEDDLGIEIAQPQIGLLSNGGVQVIHGYAWVPTHLGWYVTDGAAWYFMSLDIDSVFIREYEAHRFNYEGMWSVHDPNTRVYVAGVGTHTDTAEADTRWIADYKPTIPLAGGGMQQPNWMYDTSARPYYCGAALALPRSRRADVFFGGPDGFIYKQDSTLNNDDSADTNLKTMHIISATEYMGDCGGDLAHGKEVTDVQFYLRAEFSAWEGRIHAGDAEPYPQAIPSFDTGIIPASFAEILTPDNVLHTMQPEWTHRFPTPQLVGQGFQFELLVPSADPDVEFAGYDLNWHDGPYDRFSAVDTPQE